MVVRNAATMGSHGAAWEYQGYFGSGNVENLLGSLQGRTALVCGNAYTVFQDYDNVLTDDAVVFAVNDCGVYLPRVDHMVSLHVPKLAHWLDLRIDGEGRFVKGTRAHTISETSKIHPTFLYHWSGLTPVFSLSGYFAMQIAYLMGADRIILVGCPGDYVPRFYELKPRKDNFGYGNGTKHNDKGVMLQLTNEMTRLPEFKAKVRSCGGWTKSFFGSP